MTLTAADIPTIQKAIYVQFSAAVLPIAPLLYLRMDAATGVTEANLGSGGSAGTYTNTTGTIASGITLNTPGLTADGDASVTFAGTNGILQGTGLVLGNGSNFTVSFLVNPVSAGYIFFQGTFGVDSAIQILWAGGFLLINGFQADALPANVPSFVTMAFTPTECTTNINGVQTSVRALGLTTCADGAWQVGGAWDGGSIHGPFGGVIDEVAVFPGLLTAAQSLSLYQAAITAKLAAQVNVGEWAGLTVPASLPNSGPVGLTDAAYLAVADAILGSAQSTNPGSSSVVNRDKVLPYYCASRYERVVWVGFGDSNQLKDAWGWTCGFGNALANKSVLWGTGLVSQGGAGSSNLNYLCQAAGSDAITGAPSGLNQYMPTTPQFGLPFYAYAVSGQPTLSFSIEVGHPILTGDISLHATYGLSPGWTGSFTMGGRFSSGPLQNQGLPPFLPPATSIDTGGNSSLVDGTWEFGPDQLAPGTSQITFDIGNQANVGSTGVGAGQTFFTYWQAEDRQTHSGFSVQTLLYLGAESTAVELANLLAFGQTALKEYLRQAMLYAGPSKNCLIRWNGGLDDRSDGGLSWNKNTQNFSGPAINSSQQGVENNVEGIMLTIMEAWTANGFPASSLYFQLAVSHAQSFPDDPQLASYRIATDNLSNLYPNTCSVHSDLVTSFADLSYTNSYLASDPPPEPGPDAEPHLYSPTGYNYAAALELDAVLPIGVEVVTDAVNRRILASGRGPFTLTLTVLSTESGSTPLPSVDLALNLGITTLQGETNGLGQATFGIGPGTWSLTAFLTGFQYAGSTITITGNQTATIFLTPTVILPPPPTDNELTGYLYTQIPGTTIYYAMTIVPPGSGMQLSGLTQAHTSDSSGLWSVPLYLGATYTFNSGNGPTNTILVPSSGTTLELQNLLSL